MTGSSSSPATRCPTRRRRIRTGQLVDGAGSRRRRAARTWQADGGALRPSALTAAPPLLVQGFWPRRDRRQGRFTLETIKPGQVPGPNGAAQAPHIVIAIHLRGILSHLYTRIYFGDEATANAADPVLKLVPADRRDTLIAKREGSVYKIDFQIQGDRETVFFDI